MAEGNWSLTTESLAKKQGQKRQVFWCSFCGSGWCQVVISMQFCTDFMIFHVISWNFCLADWVVYLWETTDCQRNSVVYDGIWWFMTAHVFVQFLRIELIQHGLKISVKGSLLEVGACKSFPFFMFANASAILSCAYLPGCCKQNVDPMLSPTVRWSLAVIDPRFGKLQGTCWKTCPLCRWSPTSWAFVQCSPLMWRLILSCIVCVFLVFD